MIRSRSKKFPYVVFPGFSGLVNVYVKIIIRDESLKSATVIKTTSTSHCVEARYKATLTSSWDQQKWNKSEKTCLEMEDQISFLTITVSNKRACHNPAILSTTTEVKLLWSAGNLFHHYIVTIIYPKILKVSLDDTSFLIIKDPPSRQQIPGQWQLQGNALQTVCRCRCARYSAGPGGLNRYWTVPHQEPRRRRHSAQRNKELCEPETVDRGQNTNASTQQSKTSWQRTT